MISFLCPVCKKPLVRKDKSYFCENGHCYDIAKSGYVNLLQSGSSGHHGDDKLMVRSRTEFLNKGFYAALCDAIVETVHPLLDSSSILVDAGCGEGYYTDRIQKETGATVFGIDISKDALAAAGKRNHELKLATASTASMPLPDRSADVLISVFAPLFPEEFSRVLKDTGYLLCVFPLEKHLWELKQAVYDVPYENPAPENTLPGFSPKTKRNLEYTIHLPDTDSILQIFKMTPYYYKTGMEDQKKLEKLESLQTSLAFQIVLYEKKEI